MVYGVFGKLLNEFFRAVRGFGVGSIWGFRFWMVIWGLIFLVRGGRIVVVACGDIWILVFIFEVFFVFRVRFLSLKKG